MIPRFQTRFGVPVEDGGEAKAGEPLGNCFAAAVCSVLEYKGDLPELVTRDEDWVENVVRFAESLGYRTVNVEGGHAQEYAWLADGRLGALVECDMDLLPFDDHHVAVGTSPRGPWGHAVVACGSNLVHDPNPQGGFLDGQPFSWWFFIKGAVAREEKAA